MITFSPFDVAVLFCLILFQIGLGIVISLKDKGSDDYFMAGRSLRWWAVGGSVFSTNVSATHLIGMLGIGFSVGFAQSHYEVLAVFAILLLAFVFIPVYRKMHIFTLSQFLEKRFGPHARLVYAVLMLILILVQLVANFYIGARAISLLTHSSEFELSYFGALLLLAAVTCSYTFFGGLKAVVYTDMVQAVFIITVAVLLSYLTFSQPEINGFSGLMDIERSLPDAERKLRLMLPSNHPSLPYTGVFTGLILLHCFYWITNQFLVQRVIAAKSDAHAKVGVMFAGFLKLGIPFVSIATGIAAAHLFRFRGIHEKVLPDDAFVYLVNEIVPQGYGLVGLIFSGVTAATFSTLDSMMNSATTIFSVDIYRKYIKPDVSDKNLVSIGRISTAVLSLGAALLAYVTYDPSGAGNFFLAMSSYGSYVTPGIIVVFFAALFVRNISPMAAVLTMLSAPLCALGLEEAYAAMSQHSAILMSLFGEQLNFLHRVAATFISSGIIMYLVSASQKSTINPYSDGTPMLSAGAMGSYFDFVLLFFILHLACVLLVATGILTHTFMAMPAALFSGLVLLLGKDFKTHISLQWSLVRVLAAVMTACAVAILYYFAL